MITRFTGSIARNMRVTFSGGALYCGIHNSCPRDSGFRLIAHIVYGFGVPMPEKPVKEVEPNSTSLNTAPNGAVFVGIVFGIDTFQS